MNDRNDSDKKERAGEGNGTQGNPTGKSSIARKLVRLLILILLVAVGIYYLFNYFQNQRRSDDFVRQIKILVVDSPTVADILGEPVQVIEPHQLTKGKDDFRLQFRLTGTNGEGTVVVVGRLNRVGSNYVELIRESLKLEFGDEVFDINPDAELIPDIEIDFGN